MLKKLVIKKKKWEPSCPQNCTERKLPKGTCKTQIRAPHPRVLQTQGEFPVERTSTAGVKLVKDGDEKMEWFRVCPLNIKWRTLNEPAHKPPFHFPFEICVVVGYGRGRHRACLLCSAKMTKECPGRRKKALPWLSASLTHLSLLQNTKYPETLVGI